MRHLEDYEHRFLEIIAKGLEARARSKAEGKTIVYGSEGFSESNASDDITDTEE